jgi:hypothetical protein
MLYCWETSNISKPSINLKPRNNKFLLHLYCKQLKISPFSTVNIQHEFVKTLLNRSIKDNARQMFEANFDFNGFSDRMPLEMYEISFRLFKPTSSYVNLEFLLSSNMGRCFQPIGFYDSKMNIYILNEYASAYEDLVKSGQVSDKVSFLDKKVNAVIAAFSIKTIELVFQIFKEFNIHGWEQNVINGVLFNPMLRYDRRFECNGFSSELLFSQEGYPQFYLDDEHELEGAIGAYIQGKNGKLNIHPTIEYKSLFDKLSDLKLLTAFTII